MDIIEKLQSQISQKVDLPCSYYDIELVTKDGKTLKIHFCKIDSNNNTFDTMPSRLKEIF